MSRPYLVLIFTAALTAPTAAFAGRRLPRIGHWFPRNLDDDMMPVVIVCVAALAVLVVLRLVSAHMTHGSAAWQVMGRLRIVTTLIALGSGGIFVADRMEQDAQAPQVAATTEVRHTTGGAKFIGARTD